jgi:hypothetical protein
MDLHVPATTKGELAQLSNHITDRLDAVVLHAELSSLYEGSVHLTLAGNPRDLAIAAERASRLGGVVD